MQNKMVPAKQKYGSFAHKVLRKTSYGGMGAVRLPLGSRGKVPGMLSIVKQISSLIVSKFQAKCFLQSMFEKGVCGDFFKSKK